MQLSHAFLGLRKCFIVPQNQKTMNGWGFATVGELMVGAVRRVCLCPTLASTLSALLHLEYRAFGVQSGWAPSIFSASRHLWKCLPFSAYTSEFNIAETVQWLEQ